MTRKLYYILFGTIPALLWGIGLVALLLYADGRLWYGYILLAAVWGYWVAPVHNGTTQGRKRLITSVLLLIGLVASASFAIANFTMPPHHVFSVREALVIGFFSVCPAVVALHYLAESVFIWKRARSSSIAAGAETEARAGQ